MYVFCKRGERPWSKKVKKCEVGIVFQNVLYKGG